MSDKLFVEKFYELSLLYFDVKEKIILAEEIYEKFPVTLTNEVRNSYDHIFRIFLKSSEKSDKELEKQFISASRHLKRAGYDACELIVGGYVAQINQILHRYSFDILNQVFGSRYPEIKIFINDTNSKYLVEARSKKNLQTLIEDDIEIDDLYPQFASIISKIRIIWEDVVKHEPLFEECKQELNRKSQNDIIKKVVIGVLLILLGMLIPNLFSKTEKVKNPPRIENNKTEFELKSKTSPKE